MMVLGMVLFDFIIFGFPKFLESVNVCISLNFGSFQTFFQKIFLPISLSSFSKTLIAHIIGFLKNFQKISEDLLVCFV